MRRIFASLTVTTLAGSSVLIALPAHATQTSLGDLTVLATTDIHGHEVDYDYFTGQAFSAKDKAKALGMDHLATAIKQVRAEKGADSTLLLDNGDANQGASLETFYHSHRSAGSQDPMASVFNTLGYDAGVLGNHEFNYGLDDLAQYKSSLKMPLLAANVLDAKTGKPAFTPYTNFTKTVGGKQVKIAVVGVVTPGVEVWDKANVEGKLIFQDAAAAAAKYSTQAKQEGADVVIVLAHTGLNPEGSVYKESDKAENVAKSVAEQSTDVDLVVGGHTHVLDKTQEYFTNKKGKQVLFTQPGYWAKSVSEVELPLTLDNETGKIAVDWSNRKPTAVALKAGDYAQDPAILQAIQPWYDQTNQWVKTVIAQSTETMKADVSPWEDTPIVDFINKVQTDEVTQALATGPYANLPVLSEASPFSRTAVFKKGDVTIADMAGLYIYDNTLYAVKLNGAQLKDYLEWSARYYQQQTPGAQISDWSTVTNAKYPGSDRGIPDYSYDVLSGVSYHINISQPVGQRIENLTLSNGTPVTDSTEVILALNNYRWAGGSGYPHVTKAPVVYNDQVAVRELMIEWAINHKTINPAEFFTKSWTVSTSSEIKTAPTPTGATPTSPAPTTPAPTAPAPVQSASATPSTSPAPSTSASASVAPSNSASASAPVAPSASASSSAPAGVVISGNSAGHNPGSQNPPQATAGQKSLAYTGSQALLIGTVALGLLAVGVALVSLRRRQG